MNLTKNQEAINQVLGCNVFGRLEHVQSLVTDQRFEEARRAMIELANFLPGNLVVTIGDDDQQQLDWNEEDES